MARIIVSFSGGMDSATLLAQAIADGHTIQAVGFAYGSKHGIEERKAADLFCKHINVPHQIIDLTGIFERFNSSLLLNSESKLPEGHYEEESMRQTVVPGRNIIFASILAGYAWSQGAEQVWLGIHAGDHFVYPDCRPDFFAAMREAVRLGTERITLLAPFINKTKAEILTLGLALRVPYHLTRTCYSDSLTACGRCGACQERLESFQKNGLADPLPYITRTLLPKKG